MKDEIDIACCLTIFFVFGIGINEILMIINYI